MDSLKSPFVWLVLLLLTVPAHGQQGAPPASAPGTAIMPGATAADPSPALLSYALGFSIGNDLRSGGVEIDLQNLMAGASDGLKGSAPKWTEAECQSALEQFQQQMQQNALAQLQQSAQANQQQAAAFLAQNRQRDGVVQTASGLQYRVLREGQGPSPTLADTVRCNYRGTLLDGTEFDSSYGRGRPAEFPVRGVIDGWTEALQKMRVGSKWQLFVPSDLAYGMDPPGPPLEPGSMLIFEVELLEILPE